MAEFLVEQTPVFSETMEQITTKDRAAPDTFNPRYQTLLDNDNYLNGKLKRSVESHSLTVPAAGWSGAAPYTQTVSAPWLTEADGPVLGLRIADGTAAAAVKAQSKAWGCVDRAVTGNGTVTFYCYSKKPAVDFVVLVKGV